MASWSDYAVRAAYVVENFFPPKNTDEVYQVAVALNLLNTVVKQPEGKHLTSYAYIKGMAACLFVWLMYHPQEGVDIFWDKAERIAYLRIRQRQFSFHYVPLMRHFLDEMERLKLHEQRWDGIRLQTIATKLFDDLSIRMPAATAREPLRHLMMYFNMSAIKKRIDNLEGVPQIEWKQKAKRHVLVWTQKRAANKWHNLMLALSFDGFDRNFFELHRQRDHWRVKVIRYTGNNYDEMKKLLSAGKPADCCLPEYMLEKGALYYVRRKDWTWRKMNYKKSLLLRAHYDNLLQKGRYYNLCVTYRIARYLALIFPELRFVNVLNYTRFKVHRHMYSYRDLVRVPMRSKARVLKVWMPVDMHHDLRRFNIYDLPEILFQEYEIAEDYADFFRKEYHKGCVGLVAYSRFHLLKPVYKEIEIRGHYARVRNHCGKWAIYSLMLERFMTDFIYDSIWYDNNCFAILGTQHNKVVIIHQMARGWHATESIREEEKE